MELFLDRKVMGNLQNMAEVDVSCPRLQVVCYHCAHGHAPAVLSFLADPVGCERICLVILF